jgi:hypothetical protein
MFLMTSFQPLWRGAWISTLVLVLLLPSFCHAAEESPALVVGEAGANLYAGQDDQAAPIAKLQGGEELEPLAHIVGDVPWYLVRTRQGAVGWVKASDVNVSERTKDLFKESGSGQLSTWAAVTDAGRTFGGTWTAAPAESPDAASGAWTLRDDTGKTILSGAWSAKKFDTGWRGVWRASVDGKKEEYSGSWTAAAQLGSELSFAALFEAAAQDAIRGIWTGGKYGGSWAIRAGK